MSDVDTTKELTGISACYGIGGLDEGVERALEALRHPYRTAQEQKDWYDRGNRNLRHAAILEIEAVAAWNVVAQMENGILPPAPVWPDLKSFDWAAFYGKVHCILGGYPCQPFSQAGLQGGTEDPRHLFPYLEQGIDATRPVFCYFENVANHLKIGFEEVRDRLQRLGYKAEAGIYAAENVGAPHLRKRLFILAVADTYCTEQSKRRGDLAEVLGIPEIQRQSKHRAAVSGGNSSWLGNSDGPGSQGRNAVRQSALSSESSQTMGNSNNGGQQQCSRDDREIRGWSDDAGEIVDNSARQFSEQEDQIPAGWNSAPGSGQSVDNSLNPRLEGYSGNVSRRHRWQDTIRSIAEASLWPRGQGIHQHEWEEPRLESRLGFTVDGHDYTEDLLRMAGNAVVPQQAEAAFRDLITENFL